MTTHSPLPPLEEGDEPSLQAVPAPSHDSPPLVHEDRGRDMSDPADQERARIERTARYLKGPTAFSA
ncbi:hypothetical protein [Microvirga rosea]|uniref:hypothetical protein n=1 Tax=Microvirga rosea TaxID=2715425 RepID=UPI001D0A93F5|nr:hypothetical protein [Microvirga rosea]MCB8821545.1 hypothetical protein [Microvirga rosea]